MSPRPRATTAACSDLDPRNATALAGLASMADLSHPESLEEQLRNDISRYPQSAALHFALGNLYASRNRWEEAQSLFFEALRLEPSSADTLSPASRSRWTT